MSKRISCPLCGSNLLLDKMELDAYFISPEGSIGENMSLSIPEYHIRCSSQKCTYNVNIDESEYFQMEIDPNNFLNSRILPIDL